MLLQPRHFIRLIDGRLRDSSGRQLDRAVVATLPLGIGAYMPTRSPKVLLGREYAQKMMIKHHLRYEDFTAIKDLIEDSHCIREKANHLTFMGYKKSNAEAFILVLKTARGGDETWVVTLHRSKEAQLRSKLRRYRSNLIREVASEFDE